MPETAYIRRRPWPEAILDDSFDISSLYGEFRDEARDQLGQLDAALAGIEERGGLEEAEREELLRALHTLKGNAGMMGRAGIADPIHAVEAVFKAPPSPWPVAVVEALIGIASALRAAIEAIGTDEEQAPTARAADGVAALHSALRTAVGSPRGEQAPTSDSGSGEGAPGDADGDREHRDDTGRRAEREAERAGQTGPDGEPATDDDTHAPPRPGASADDTPQESRPSDGPYRDGAAGRPARDTRHGTVPGTEAAERVATTDTEASPEADRQAVEGHDVRPTRSRTGTGGDEAADAGASSEIDRLQEAGGGSVRGRATAAPEPAAGEVVRVPFAGLDTLLTRAGELVTLDARVESLLTRHRDALEAAGIRRDFEDLSEQLDRVTGFLQETTMELRLIPARRVFERFAPVVRDLARQNDREIRFVTEGDEVRIDKGLADALADPLLHLVRNAVDHGFDDAHPSGTIRLAAERAGDRVRITVEDDGRGIDTDTVIARARERGIIAPDDEPDERDARDLIFRSGFSTRAEATTVSGRGVGLDVVRRRIVALRGRVHVETAPSGGTRFVLDLPLTLAIVTVVLFESGGEVLALPASDVEETARDISIRRAGGAEVTRHRGELIPIARPWSLFGWEWNGNGAEAPGKPDDTRSEPFAIVVRRGDRCAAVLATRLLDQREVVIKALPRYLGPLPAVSGAAVTHEADVVLVLDAGGILDLNLSNHRR